MTVDEMKNVDISTVEKDLLADITKVHLDKRFKGQERMNALVEKGVNPFCYRVGDAVVKNVYSGDGVSMQERLRQLVRKK